MRDEKRPLLPPGANDHSEVNVARRRFAKAGLGGSAILVTLASRPVLGATCMTPSAAGSGNHSQHVNNPTCILKTDSDFISNAVGYNPADGSGASLWPSPYKPDALFHPFFTAGGSLNYRDSSSSNSYTLFEVLVGRKWPIVSGNRVVIPANWATTWTTLISPTVASPLAQAFVVALLNAAPPNNYYVVLPDMGEPSVKGIEDEYAHNGYYEVTAGQKWYADTILKYLQNPGSVF
jgi:hypothetical protein